VDGKRYAESSGSTRKGDAERLLRWRVGEIDRGMPLTPQAGRITFSDAADALMQNYRNKKRRSITAADRRIRKHLLPCFGGRRLASTMTGVVSRYVRHRQEQGVISVNGPRTGERVRDVSNAEINRELTLLKRMFSLAEKAGQLLHCPYIAFLTSMRNDLRDGFPTPRT
jgi:hypothetical protein